MKSSRKILKNMFSLSIAEIANKGIVFVTTAILARVILPDGFGVIGFANNIVIYFLLIVNLGFNTVGTREIAKFPNRINKYVNSILTIRSMLSVISYILLFFSVYLFNKPVEVRYVVWIAGINLFSNAILLDWVYLGTEKMEILALRQLVTSLLNLSGIVIFVHNKNDTAVAMGVMAASAAINSVWMLLLYRKMFGSVKPDFDTSLWRELMKSSLPITFSNFSIVILNTLNVVMLSAMRTDEETGYYFAAYKILLLAIIPTGIVQNAFFPLISRSATLEERRKVMNKYTLLMYLFGAIISVGFFTFSDFIVLTAFGESFSDSIYVLKILMIVSFIVYISMSYNPPLVGWGKEKSVMYAIAAGGIVNITLNLILIPTYGVKGAAWTSVISEGIVCLGLTYCFYKTLRKLYIVNLLKFLGFSLIACAAGYYILLSGIYPLIAGAVSLSIFLAFVFVFKLITISELKGYFAK